MKQERMALGVRGDGESLSAFLGVVDAKQAMLRDHPPFDL
jgi:hypothetical protein